MISLNGGTSSTFGGISVKPPQPSARPELKRSGSIRTLFSSNSNNANSNANNNNNREIKKVESSNNNNNEGGFRKLLRSSSTSNIMTPNNATTNNNNRKFRNSEHIGMNNNAYVTLNNRGSKSPNITTSNMHNIHNSMNNNNSSNNNNDVNNGNGNNNKSIFEFFTKLFDNGEIKSPSEISDGLCYCCSLFARCLFTNKI